MARNMFMDAIKNEQKRIQGFIDLSSNFETDRGCLYVQKHGTNLYGYERKRSKDGTVQKIYLGPIASEKVQELFSIRLKTQRLSRLRHNQSLLNNIERSYQMYDFGSIVLDMPKAYRMAALGDSFDQRYEEIRK